MSKVLTQPPTNSAAPGVSSSEMVAARHRQSIEKRQRVRDVIDEMMAREERVTFTEVSRRAGVSRALLYEPGVRESVERARGFAVGHTEPRRRIDGPPVDLSALAQCVRDLTQQQSLLVRKVDHLAEQIKWQTSMVRNGSDLKGLRR